MRNKIVISGIRGVPASHGGFETFAEYLALYLVNKGWDVSVYCQVYGDGCIYRSEWEGISLVHIPINRDDSFGTVLFDLRVVMHSRNFKGVVLTLGYNTAVFNILYRFFKIPNVINMDGIEWKRKKWGKISKAWFWVNERLGCWFGNHLIADHPSIEDHLSTRVSRKKITMIPYGGLQVLDAKEEYLSEYKIEKDRYAIVIARPEPENSILEIIQGFSAKKRNCKLVVLGKYDVTHSYHKQVLEAASDEVLFVGAIYDVEKVSALRFFARCYVHGHQVGGTNPSLVESIGAGNAIVAHDNKFNRWVAKEGALYFDGKDTVSQCFDQVFQDDQLVESLKNETRQNFDQNFRWEKILGEYETLLEKWHPR